MIVDDEADLRETLKDLLEIYGYAVITASNGREALELLKRQDVPCLVLLDLMMPVMNGWEFLEALQAERPADADELPIVVISAAADVADVERRYGCHVMRKPLNLKHLASMANQYCRI